VRGHIRKRGGAWSVVVDTGRDPGSGRRRQKWHSGFRTRKDAQRALADILSRLDRGTYVEPSRQTVAEYLAEWLAAIRTRVRPGTWESYERNVRSHIDPAIGSTRLQDLSAATLNRFYADLLAAGRADGKGPLSPRTVRYIHTIVRKALHDAVRWNRLARNVADTADPPSPRAAKAAAMTTWSAAQLRRFLQSIRDDRLYPAFLLAATTGMRRGEVLGLHWCDVDLDAARISIRHALITVRYELAWSTPKTDRGRRTVALDPATVEALRSRRARQLEERLLLGSSYRDDDLVFCQPDGTPIHPDSFSGLFERLVARADLPRIRFHDLRHTHASLALAAGVHPKVVSERLGHADIALTLNTYSHAIPALQESAASVVANLVLGRIE
jgi:integrase